MDMGTGHGACLFLWPARCSDGCAVSRRNVYRTEQHHVADAAGLSLVDAGQIYNLPELINNQWVRRYDITVTLQRKNTRTFNIKTIQSAPFNSSESKLWHRVYLYQTSLTST
jgi:aspartyl/asparaginyl beta-hydroxylase (cupin superfamily)